MKILLSLIKKEIKQILRDPSSIVIAFIESEFMAGGGK